MVTPRILNRDFYIKMRIKGYTHQNILSAIFPTERTPEFNSHVEDLENIDFTNEVDIDKLVDAEYIGENIGNKSKNKIKK